MTFKERTDRAVAHKLRDALMAAKLNAETLQKRGYSVNIVAAADDDGFGLELRADITRVDHVNL